MTGSTTATLLDARGVTAHAAAQDDLAEEWKDEHEKHLSSYRYEAQQGARVHVGLAGSVLKLTANTM